jgi:hypothetical protein
MRQFFLPACVCLVTWSGATNSGPRFSLDEFTGATKRGIAAPAAERGLAAPERAQRDAEALIGNVKIASLTPDDFAPRDVEAPVTETTHASTEKPAPKLLDEEIAAVLDGLAIESPVPSGEVVNNGIPAGIPLPPVPTPVVARSQLEVCGSLAEAALRNDLPAPFFIRLLFQESRFNPAVVSSAGAQGIAQFMPETATSMGVDNPFDPLQAIPASARLLRELIQKFGNLGLAAAAYNAGPKKIADWLTDRRKHKLPEETQGYVKTITGKPVENWSAAAARHPGMKLPRRAPCQEAAGLLAWDGPDAVPLPAAAPMRVAALVAAAEKIKAEKDKAAKAKTEKDKSEKAKTEKVKPEPKTADKSKEKEMPKAAAQVASHKQAPKHEPKHKPERIAQR